MTHTRTVTDATDRPANTAGVGNDIGIRTSYQFSVHVTLPVL